MNKLLMIALLLVGGSAYGQSKYKVSDKEILAEIERVTPHRNWVKSVDNSKWYYGYYRDNKFYYTQSYMGGLSDLSSLYPLSYRCGEMRNQPRVQTAKETEQEQFNRVTKKEVKVKPVPFVKGHSKGFNWLFEPKREKKHKDFHWE